MDVSPRNPDIDYIHPETQLYAGIWALYAGATVFLIARIWVKIARHAYLWYDDYILIAAWLVLTANDIIITVEWATGYVAVSWGARMHILIIISSCGTLLGQTLTKLAFAVTLLKLTRGFAHWKTYHSILWSCVAVMCLYNLSKMVVEWSRVCGSASYDVSYRLDFCMHDDVRNRFKAGGQYVNVVVDFIFACFPWVITWNLDMKRREKIGLCLTLSLGMVVAITTAIRNEWKYNGNGKDQWYFWRLAMSNIWYSSEVTGTIIVQCIPVLRPLVTEVTKRVRSKRLGSTTEEGVEMDLIERQWMNATGGRGTIE